MKLIEDLGMIEKSPGAQRKRYWILQCPNCPNSFIARADHVKNGTTAQCRDCIYLKGSASNIRAAATKFVAQANCKHNNYYTYDNLVYTKAIEDIIVTCPKHGDFSIQAHYHLNGGGGCKSCMGRGGVTMLYYFKIDGVYKIGITANMLEGRYNTYDRSRMSEIQTWIFDTRDEAYKYEQSIIKLNARFAYTGDTPFTDGTLVTECFSVDIYNLKEEL